MHGNQVHPRNHSRNSRAHFVIATVAALALGVLPCAATSHWICLDGDYYETSCWDDGIPSDPGEVGIIDEDGLGVAYVVTFDGDGGAGTISLAVPDARWYMANSSFNPAFSFNVVPGAEVLAVNSDFVGMTGVYTNGGKTTFVGTCTVDLADFQQNNELIMDDVIGNTVVTFMNDLTNNAHLQIEGSPSGIGFTRLSMPNNALINLGVVTLNVTDAHPSSYVSLDADLDNQNQIFCSRQVRFDKPGGSYANSGQIVVLDDSSVSLSGGSTLTNTGFINVSNTNSKFTLGDATIENNGGTIIVDGDNALFEFDTGACLRGGTLRTLGSGKAVVLFDNSPPYTKAVDNITLDGYLETGVNAGEFVVRGTLTNLGRIHMPASFGGFSNIRFDSDATIAGGEISTTATVSSLNNTIEAADGASGVTVTLDGVNLHGVCQLGRDTLGIVNQSVIIADAPSDPIKVDPDDTLGFDNTQGQLVAASGATMELLPGPYANAGGLILAEDGGAMLLSGPTIAGGTLHSDGAGTFNATTLTRTTIEDVTMETPLQVGDNATLATRGQITNTLGQINLVASPFGIPGATMDLETDTTIVGGTMNFSDSPTNQIRSSGSPQTLTLNGVTLHGSGNIGFDEAGTVNQGEITADNPFTGSNPLAIDPDDTLGFDNTAGVLSAEAGGKLDLRPGPYTNTGGLIVARNMSTVRLNGPTITGGTLRGEGTGFFEAIPVVRATLQDFVLEGPIQIGNNVVLNVSGQIDNSGGSFNLTASPFANPGATLDLVADTTITGGAINFSDAQRNQIRASAGPVTLTLEGTSIRGSGNVGFAEMGIVNRGTITADNAFTGSNALVVSPDETLGLDNQGALAVESGAKMQFNLNGFVNNGLVRVESGGIVDTIGSDNYVQDSGTTVVNGGMNVGTAFNLTAGLLAGSGTISGGSVFNLGGLTTPGDGIGVLTVPDYGQYFDSELEIEIGGTTPGVEYDQIITGFQGFIQLGIGNIPGGRLKVKLVNGFVPDNADSFTIGHADLVVSGRFDNAIPPGYDPNAAFDPNATYGPAELQTRAGVFDVYYGPNDIVLDNFRPNEPLTGSAAPVGEAILPNNDKEPRNP